MPDRTIILATNGRHGLRGLTQVNPQEFLAYQDEGDDLTYVADTSAYGEGATLSTVTRTPYGPTVTNTSNTTTRITQRIKGFGYVDIKFTTSAGDSDQFRIVIQPRAETVYSQNYDPAIAVPLAYTAAVDPAISDDSTDNHVPGTLWLNTATLNEFRCISNAVGAARWRFVPRSWISTAASSTLTGTTSETVLSTLTLPGGVAGPNGVFEIRNAWEINNDASSKLGGTRLGAAGAGLSGTLLRSNALTSSIWAMEGVAFKNENSQAAQRCFNTPAGSAPGGWGGGGSVGNTGAINTANAFDIIWTGTLADSADSLTLRMWIVTLNRPDIAP